MAHLGEEFDHVLFDARVDARSASRKQAELELDISVIDAAAFTEEDRSRAHLIAMSLSSAIGMSALILLRQGKDNPLRLALALEDYRLRRVAATEIPNAYSRQHYEIDPGEGWARRWDATLDLKTCRVCFKMHGTVVALDEDFPDGLVPGDVHPNCRCEPEFVPIALLKAA
jgi:Phage Mu protein F like protein